MRPADTLAHAITQGATLLQHYRPYWAFNAFTAALGAVNEPLAPIYQRLLALDENALWQLDNDEALQAAHFHDDFAAVFTWQVAQLPPDLSQAEAIAWPFWLHTDIPGRKWQQIQAFCQHLPPASAALEWCAGKGHLGRAYGWQHQACVTSIEYQAVLCEQGRALADKTGVNQSFIQGDVYQWSMTSECKYTPLWLAMHACGALHLQFLHQACVHDAQHIALAPCCYHRQQGAYAAMSKPAQTTQLVLDTEALRLAQQNQVTAGASERARRAQALRWRLGYELMRQDTLGDSHYRPLPSLKLQQFSDFQDFCRYASEHHQCHLDLGQCEHFEALGEQARLRMLRLDAIRHCFRRPLELWLLLDKMAYLVQQGFSVRALQFCAATDTPRNLLLLASKI